MATTTQTVETYKDSVLVSSRQVTITTTPEQDNALTIQQQALNALANNRTFTALASPTNAQTLAQVQALTKQMNGVIRLLLNQLDGTN